jgi:PAS domain S-box-containing protein
MTQNAKEGDQEKQTRPDEDKTTERSSEKLQKSHQRDTDLDTKDGSAINVAIDDSLERDEDGKVISFRTALVDITKLKVAEESLKKSEEHFRALVEKSGIAISTNDEEGNLIYCNSRYADIFGYSMEEMRGQSILSIVHADDVERVMTYHRGRLLGKVVPSRYEFKGIRKDRSVIYLEVDVNVLRERERLSGSRSYMWDITDRKRTEENLRKRSARLELIHHIQSEIPLSADIEAVLNQTAESIGKTFGYYKISVNLYDRAANEIEYLTGWNKTGLSLPRGHRQKLGQGLIGKAGLLKQTILANDVSQEPDYIPFHLTETKGELVVPLLVQDHFIGVLDLQATEVDAFSKDDIAVLESVASYIAFIIDRKKREETLQESEERYKSLFFEALDGICLADAETGMIIDCNNTMAAMVGRDRAELIGQHQAVLHSSNGDKAALSPTFRQHLADKAGQVLETQIVTKTGEIRDVEIKANLLSLRGKKMLQGIFRDITERKRAEEALRESEAKLKEAQALSRIGSWEFDLDKQSIQWSDQVYRLYERDPTLGPPTVEEEAACYSPEQAGRLHEYARIAVEQGRAFEYDLEARLPSGRIAQFTSTLRPIKNESGRVIKLFGTVQDITERKRAEEELRNSEERFKILFEYAPDAYYLSDLTGNFIDGNKTAEKLLGYKREEFIGKNFLKIGLLSLDEFHKAASLLAMNAAGRPTGPDEFIVKNKDGGKVAVEIRTYPVTFKEQALVLGIARDITERKKAEQTLRENEEKYRTLTENIKIGVYRNTVGPQGRFLEANRSMVKMFGFKSKNKFMAGNVSDFYQNEEDGKAFNEKMIRKGYVRNEELFLKKNDGAPFIGSVSAVAVKDARGNVKYYDGTIEDITKRKQTEDKLQQAVEKIRQALGSIVNVVAATIEMKDRYTAGHQKGVAELARAIATEMGLPTDQIEGIRIAGTIHDLGKIFVPGEILCKPGKLNEYEFSIIKLHPEVAFDILKDIKFPWPIAQIVYQHHERMDGSGYPRGQKGEQILVEARILGVADVVEAMTAHRPYRPALGIEAALAEITQKRGILYDPEVVDACVRLFSRNQLLISQMTM